MRVRYRPIAIAQLDAIAAYLSRQNPVAAQRVLARIKASIALLTDFPHSARVGTIPGVRELPIVRYPYIVLYSVNEAAGEVMILRVRHTAQDPSRHLE